MCQRGSLLCTHVSCVSVCQWATRETRMFVVREVMLLECAFPPSSSNDIFLDVDEDVTFSCFLKSITVFLRVLLDPGTHQARINKSHHHIFALKATTTRMFPSDLSASSLVLLVAPLVVVTAAAVVKWIEKSVEDPSEAMKSNFVGNRHVRCNAENASFGGSFSTTKVVVQDEKPHGA